MFAQLPQECLLMILDYILEETPSENQHAHLTRGFRDAKEWKKPLSSGEIKKYSKRNILWKSPPFTRVLPLTMISNEMNETVDTNEVWTYLYEKEFRKGKGYKRKPKDAKKMMLDKSKGIIRKRYHPLYEFEKTECESFLAEIKGTMKQLHKLDTGFSNIKPQIRDASLIDDDEKMDKLPIILPQMIKLPKGYVDTWGHVTPHEIHVTLEHATRDRIVHQRTGTQLIRKKKRSKEIVKKIERIIEKIGVPCSAHITWVPNCSYCQNH
jgi:hypothetical protein